MATVLESHFNNTIENFASLQKNQKILCQTATLDYIFKTSSASAYEAKIKHTIRKPVRLVEARRGLLRNGYLMKDVKLHLLQKSCGVKRPLNVGEDRKLWNYATAKQKTLWKKLGNNVPILKDEFDDFLMYLIDNTRVFTKKFVRRKMRFIKQTHGIEFADIESFITMEALQNILFTYPRFDSIDHALNTMKRIIHNVGANYIETNTRQKVSRIYSTGEGYESKLISIHSETAQNIIEQNRPEENLDDFKFNFNLDLMKIRDDCKGTKRKLFDLCLATYCENFSDYLVKNSITRKDNDDWFYTVDFKTYVQHAIKFLNAPEEKAWVFVEKMMQKIKPYYHQII